jgi:hypothetical protein
MVTKRTAFTNLSVWGVVGCALGVLASSALTPTSIIRAGAIFLIASPHDSTELIELQTDLPEHEAAPGELRPALLTCELLFGHESLELDAKRAELRSVQLRLHSAE